MEKPEQIVVFEINKEQFAFPVLNVKEIMTTSELKDITTEEKDVIGMVMIRGNIIPVKDFRIMMNKEGIERNKKQRIIVMANEKKPTGFLVDTIVHVIKTKDYVFDDAPEEVHHLIKHTLKEKNQVIYLIEGKELEED